jgi:hypothetical protein
LGGVEDSVGDILGLDLNGDYVEEETISNKLRWIFIGALFAIFIFLIIKIFGESAVIILAFSASFLGAIFLILNSRRFIKYQKWYISPEFLDPFFMKLISKDPFFMKLISKDEKTIAWMHILIGICGIILLLSIIIQFFV